MTETIDNPILNSPYEQPDRYYEIGPNGPTGQIRDGRRPSESFIPIAVTRKGKLAKWRRGGEYAGVTPDHPQAPPALGRPDRDNRVLFCQREAAETAIFLAEVAGRSQRTPHTTRASPAWR